MDEAARCVSSIVSKINFALAAKDEQIEEVIKLLIAAAESPGFWSADLRPPDESGKQDWHIVQRFDTKETLQRWLVSESRQRIVADLLSRHATVKNEEVSEALEQEAATAIVTQVRPGMEKAYFDWVFKIQSVQLKHPGFRGSYLQPPSPGRPGIWAVLLRFDSPESLESWFVSPVRKELVAQVESLIHSAQFRPVNNSFPGWVPVDAETGEAPRNWKTAMLVLLGLFPCVVLELKYLNPVLDHLQIHGVLANFLSMVLSVSFTTWVTMPRLTKVFRWWLLVGKDAPKNTTSKGALILVAIFAVEILLLWNIRR